ncbi:MAG: response regulator transcription factor [Planctomycetota bacterium]|nr:response regulator transcription factor [Planctomycetota bacterium]
MSLTALIVDDHKIIRDGLRALLERTNDITVAAEAEDGRQAVSLALKLRPGVVVMDVGMRDLNGMEATRLILDQLPGTLVIALSMHADRKFVGRMLQAGARGYLLKDCAFEELIDAIRAVHAGQVYLSQGVTGVVVEAYVNQLEGSESVRGPRLTDREREILQLLAEGKSTKAAAASLKVSVKTIETHRKNIMEKLGVDSTAAMTKFAIREGITSLDA